MARNEKPRTALAGATGAKNPIQTTADSTTSLQQGWRASKLRVRFLMRIHGLTEAQALALSVLIWGAG